jgi:hypothetical protein
MYYCFMSYSYTQGIVGYRFNSLETCTTHTYAHTSGSTLHKQKISPLLPKSCPNQPKPGEMSGDSSVGDERRNIDAAALGCSELAWSHTRNTASDRAADGHRKSLARNLS